ncbi:hypothetical protein NIES2109_49840 [Nostoc sp. HK-01]|nr:hypothetical protein NIES2109_49840 [Nostoc sp. HK-01]
MSSGSSGRYQSRLFNFVHQQSRRLTQRWEQTFRQVQVTTKWGVEALLYPLYLLLQSAESKVKTLYTKEPQPRLKLQPNYSDRPPETPLTADTPIQRVLEAVQNLPSEEITTTAKISARWNSVGKWWRKPFKHRPTNNTSLAQSLTISDNSPGSLTSLQRENAFQRYLPAVQGIATNLGDRHLVLVSSSNEILDVLTPQQQKKLINRIIHEVANYWHTQQVIEAETSLELLPEIHRLLAKLTGENTPNITQLTQGIPTHLLNSRSFLELVDKVVAKLEENALMPVQQRSQEIIQITQTQFNVFLYGKEELNSRVNIAVTPDILETQILHFQALIEAGLNYFFGIGRGKKMHSGNNKIPAKGQYLRPRNYKALPQNKKLKNKNKDVAAVPWLSWNDLFSSSPTVADNTVTPTSQQNSTLPSSPYPQKKLTIQQPKVGAGLVKRQKSSRNLIQSQKISGKVANVKQTEASEITQHQSQNHQVEAQPDWIDIKATSIGYEQHFLEKILVWLDNTMLWLEEMLMKTIKFLARLWQSK